MRVCDVSMGRTMRGSVFAPLGRRTPKRAKHIPGSIDR